MLLRFMFPSSYLHFHSKAVCPNDLIPSNNKITCSRNESCTSKKLLNRSFFQDHLLGPLLEFGWELYFFTVEGIGMCLQLCGEHTSSRACGPIGSESSMAKQEGSWVPIRQKFLLMFSPVCYLSEYDSLNSTHKPELEEMWHI